jgi:hypothetical protein
MAFVVRMLKHSGLKVDSVSINSEGAKVYIVINLIHADDCY